MDDIDRELMILDFQEECNEYDIFREKELSKNPIWWNKINGLFECTEEEYQQARKISAEFKQFSKDSCNRLTIEDKFNLFESFRLGFRI